MDEAEIIDVPRDARKQLARPAPALAVLAELPRRFHHALIGAAIARIGDRSGVVEWKLLPVIALEPRLVIERVDLAWSALHEKEDDAPGPWAEPRRFRGKWIRRRQRLLAEQSRQGQRAEAAGQLLERLAARDCDRTVHRGISITSSAD